MTSRTKLKIQNGFQQRTPFLMDFSRLKSKVTGLLEFGRPVKSSTQGDANDLYLSSEGLRFPSIEAYSAAKIDFNAAGGEAGRRMSFTEWVASGRP